VSVVGNGGIRRTSDPRVGGSTPSGRANFLTRLVLDFDIPTFPHVMKF